MVITPPTRSFALQPHRHATPAEVGKGSWGRFFLFPLSTLVNVSMTSVGVVALIEWIGVDERLAPFIAGVLAIPATFVVTRRVLVGRGGVDVPDQPAVRNPDREPDHDPVIR